VVGQRAFLNGRAGCACGLEAAGVICSRLGLVARKITPGPGSAGPVICSRLGLVARKITPGPGSGDAPRVRDPRGRGVIGSRLRLVAQEISLGPGSTGSSARGCVWLRRKLPSVRDRGGGSRRKGIAEGDPIGYPLV
jgi:hypothetical protein